MSQDIIFQDVSHLGLITLSREHALNALTLPMIIALQQQLHRWQADPNIHAVVIRSDSSKAFCAGGDVRSLYDARSHNKDQMQFFWHEYRLNYYIQQFKKPYIALMDGLTMGGGVGVALHGSHPIASERFSFAMPETGIGFFPDIGASHLLSHCPGAIGTYLGLTGDRLGPVDAQDVGLVRGIIPAVDFNQVISTLLDADLSEAAHEQVDACLQGFTISIGDASILSRESDITHCFSMLTVESIMQRLLDSHDIWCQEVREKLLKKSPLSLKVTLAQLQKAKTMTMAECIEMDYCLVGHFMHGEDFYEGIRALLIDKDKAPKWQPPSLFGVTDTMVSKYFECGQPELPLWP